MFCPISSLGTRTLLFWYNVHNYPSHHASNVIRRWCSTITSFVEFCEAVRKISLLLPYHSDGIVQCRVEVLTATDLIVVQQASAVAACRLEVLLEYILIGYFVTTKVCQFSYYYRILKMSKTFFYVVNHQNIPIGK